VDIHKPIKSNQSSGITDLDDFIKNNNKNLLGNYSIYEKEDFINISIISK
jgi:hypothetical protein